MVRILAILFLVSISLCTIKNVHAQKMEKESKIKENEFPDKAQQYLNRNFPEKMKIKYYIEESENDTYYESKFFCEDEYYSVKFYKDGSLYDTEKMIEREAIAQDTWQNIKSTFDNDFIKWKISKIQKRWYKQSVEFEITLDGKLKNEIQPFEYKFSIDGTLIEKQRIETRFNDIEFF